MTGLDDVLAALNAERYGPSLWWRRDDPDRPLPEPTTGHDDSETATARRRRAMANDFETSKREDTA